MRRIPMCILPGILCIFSLALLFVACQKESTNPVSLTGSKNVISSLHKTSQRPLSDFLSTQGEPTYWTDKGGTYYFFVDYAGALDRLFGLNLGTTFDGTITEQPLNDGTAEITVNVHSHNALTFIGKLSPPYPVVLGNNAFQVAGGATPTLGDVHFKWTFVISAPGAPIPDIFTDFPASTSISIQASAFGPLTAAAGMGPDGTPGHGWTNQVGLLTKTHGKPGIDGFTVEYIKLQPVGH